MRRIPLIAPLVTSMHSAILAIVVFLFLTCSVCLAQSPDRHYCEDGYFSFIPPDGWQVSHTSNMSWKTQNKLSRIEKGLHSRPVNGWLAEICKPATSKISRHKLILIYRTHLGGKPDIEIENDWLTEKYQRKRNKQLYSKDYFGPDNTANIKIDDAKYFYQQDLHTAFEEVKGKINDVDFVRITATILGSRTKTTLFCHFQDSEGINACGLIREIAESFEYDAGYEFGNPDTERVDSRTRIMRTSKFLLIQFCVCSLILFVGLLFYRIVSGDHIPILGMVTATISGMLPFTVTGWLGGEVFLAMYNWHSQLPYLIAAVVMVPIIWKWPKSDISLRKSAIAVCSLLFLMSLIPVILMAWAAGAGIISIEVVMILILTILAWRS